MEWHLPPLWRENPKALVNAAKFTSARFRIPGPMRRLNHIDKQLICKRNFMVDFLRRTAARKCGQSQQQKISVDIRHFFDLTPNRSAVNAVHLTDIRPDSVAGREFAAQWSICRLNLTHCRDTKLSMWRDYLCKIVNLNWEAQYETV
jgi:hypothetical protein